MDNPVHSRDSGSNRERALLDITLLAPDGVAIRNFVLGSYLKRHVERMTVLHSCPDALPGAITEGLDNVSWQTMVPMRDTALPFTLRQSLSYAHLFWADTSSMRYTRNRPVGGSWRTQASVRTAKLLGRLAASRPGIDALESSYFRSVNRGPEVKHYLKAFERDKPAIILACNHRSPSVLPPVLAAKSLGIPTVSFIASWDNLTSKGRIAAPFDHYLVWSAHMRGEMLRYYPSIDPQQIHIVGTPQFDSYADTSILQSRDEFFAGLGADPARPLICYSGGDAGNCPQDPEHVEILMDFVRAGVIRGNPQVVLRPCPVDNGERYKTVRSRFPELIFRQPAWAFLSHSDWTRCMPLPEDLRFLANLTRHADLNVNTGSTMTLDFGIHDTPVVNTCFDVGEVLPGRLPLWEYHNWEHYRPIVQLGAARFARSAEQLAEHVNTYLTDPAQDREARRQLVDLQLGAPLGDASRRIAAALKKIVSSPDSVSRAKSSIHEASHP